MKQRILVLDCGNFVAAKLQAALAASNWATPVPVSVPPASLSDAHLRGIQGVFYGAVGRPREILARASALYSALERTRSTVRVVHLSSMTVYGSQCGELTENAALRPDIGAYGAAQIEAESLAGRYARRVILRPGCEYGPGCPQWSERIARLLRSHRLGDLGAAGDGVCNLVFIDDLVVSILKSFTEPGLDGACFNVAMRAPPTWNDYFTLFARALGAIPVSRLGARRLNLESRLAAAPLKVLELFETRLRGRLSAVPPAITPSLLRLCAQNITLNSTKAEQVLGLRFTSLTEGLQRAAAAAGDA